MGRKIERGHARDCDGLQCQTLSQSNSQSNAHHRHHSSEIYKASKKRGCSCHKHRKESRKSKKKEKKSKKDKKTKQQIKFRRKIVQRAYTPRNPVPPISVSKTPRGVAVERLNAVKSFDWN